MAKGAIDHQHVVGHFRSLTSPSLFSASTLSPQPPPPPLTFQNPQLSPPPPTPAPPTQHHHQWLTYWVVYSLFSLVESSLFLVGWVPLYFELKTVLLLWLVAPQTQGAALVYERVVAPFLKSHAARLDPVFAGAERAIGGDAARTLKALSAKYGPKAAAAALEKAAAEVAAGSKPLLESVAGAVQAGSAKVAEAVAAH